MFLSALTRGAGAARFAAGRAGACRRARAGIRRRARGGLTGWRWAARRARRAWAAAGRARRRIAAVPREIRSRAVVPRAVLTSGEAH